MSPIQKPLFSLPQGYVVSIGETREPVDGFFVPSLMIYGTDGTPVLAGPLRFSTGTPYDDPSADIQIRGVFQRDDGGFSVAFGGSIGGFFQNDIYRVEISATGSILGPATLITPGATDYLATPAEKVLLQADGSILYTSGKWLLKLNQDGSEAARVNTDPSGGFESVSGGNVVEVARGYLMTYLVRNGASEAEVRGQFFDANLALDGTTFTIHEGIHVLATGHGHIDTVVLSDGRIAVAWSTDKTSGGDPDTSESAVYVKILNADGTTAVAEQLVNVDNYAGAQDWVSLFALANGEVALTYGTETGVTATNAQHVVFFDETGTAFDSYTQTGISPRDSEYLYVTTDGAVFRIDQDPEGEVYQMIDPNAAGTTGDEFTVSRAFNGELAQDGELAILNDGSAIVVYDHTNLTGYVQKVDLSDDSVTDLAIISGADNLSVAALSDGNFAVIYQNFSDHVLGRIYAPDGSVVTSEFTIHAGQSEEIEVHATSTGFFVSFTDNEGAADDLLTGQFFNNAGTAQGTAFIPQPTLEAAQAADATVLSNGTLVTVWNSDQRSTPFENHLTVQLYNAAGTSISGPTELGEINNWSPVRVSENPDGGFVVVYFTADNTFMMQKFTAAGATDGGPLQLHCQSTDDGSLPDVATISQDQAFDMVVLPNGQLVLAYTVNTANDGKDVRYGVYTLDGVIVTESRTASVNTDDDQFGVDLQVIDNKTALLVFTDDTNVQFSSQSSIQAIRIQGGDLPPGPTSGDDFVNGTDRDDTIALLGGADTFNGDNGDDFADGGAGNDTLNGDGGDDTLKGFGGADALNGGDGNDTLDGANGADSLSGGDGNDLLKGGALGDTLDGGAGNDLLQGNAGDDSALGGAGDDTINTHGGNDTVDAGEGADLVRMGGGNDLFTDVAEAGATGRDTVYGQGGNDTITGGGGNDVLYGQAGSDRIAGGDGFDRIYGGDQGDVLFGGRGGDTVAGGDGKDNATLGDGNDLWLDTLTTGAAQADTVKGGKGADTIQAGGGNDVLTGNKGADSFVFLGTAFEADRITDYKKGLDSFTLDDALWGGGLTAQHVVNTYADDSSGTVIFDFGNGNTITFDGVTRTNFLDQDLIIV